LIDISCRLDDGKVVIDVSDTGIGIPARDQARIFDLFFRARNAVEGFDGVGIGLFGARKIVEGHGGSITLQSEEGKGTTFTVKLPLARLKETVAAG
jgi:signal transduction histidine kinase